MLEIQSISWIFMLGLVMNSELMGVVQCTVVFKVIKSECLIKNK